MNTVVSGVVGFILGWLLCALQKEVSKKYGDPFSIRIVRGVVIFVVVFTWAISVVVALVSGGEISVATSGIMLSIVGYLVKQKQDEKPT